MSSPIATRSLPPHPDLDQYRKQARELLHLLQSRDTQAELRFRANHPRADELARSVKLADALLVIAREHGYASWPKFKAAVEALTLDRQDRAEAFVTAAIRNKLPDARALLARDPSLPSENIVTAAVYGDRETVEKLLRDDPTLAGKPHGRRGRVPLLYATESGFITDPQRKPGILACIRLLLAHGADPNSTFREEPWIDSPIPALYGAAGRYNDVEIATLLIDAGAKLDDGESLYHSLEHRDHRCMRLLLERGANANATNVLAHQLDGEDLEGLKLLLDYGADPNIEPPKGGNSLHWAVLRRRSPECIRLLLERGANPDVRKPNGMSAYRMALRTGQREAAELLRTPETERDITAVDRYLAAAAMGDFAQVAAIRQNDPEIASRLQSEDHIGMAVSVETGDLSLLRKFLDAGFSPNGRGTNNATALHWSAWFAHPEAVRLLLERGAEIEATGAHMGTTPLQWAFHGSGNNPEPDQERFFAVIDILLAAGAHYDPEWKNMASEEVKERYA